MSKTSKPAYEISDAEKRDLIQLIQQGKALPEKYRFIYVDEAGFARHTPQTFAVLAASFSTFQD